MKVLKVCKRIFHIVNKEQYLEANIHSVFSNSCNLITHQNDFITLLNAQKSISPHCIIIDSENNSSFIKFGLKQNTKVILSPSYISSNDESFYISMENPEICSLQPELQIKGLCEDNLKKNLLVLEHGLNRYSDMDGIGSLIALLGEKHRELDVKINYLGSISKADIFIFKRFSVFMENLFKGDFKEISKAAKNIIGFGIGLTPSMDDYISGLMVSLLYAASYYNLNTARIHSLNAEIVRYIKGRTTRVSEEMLKFSSIGEVSEDIRRLLVSLFSSNDERVVFENLLRVLNLGHTSGSDTALGIYTGCKLAEKAGFRRFFMNEA